MKVLIAMETSGELRRRFRALGASAWSCDLLPSEDNSQYHIQRDVYSILHLPWDLVIAHPTCTYMSSSGLHWNNKVVGREMMTVYSVHMVKELWRLTDHVPFMVMENPIGCLSTRFRKPDQIIQPYMFGDDASKATCLWLKNLPKLEETGRIAGRIVGYRADGKPIERWGNQTDSGQNRLGPSDDRWKERARTYPGIAQALSSQYCKRIADYLAYWEGR